MYVLLCRSHIHTVRSEEQSLQIGGLHAECHPHIVLGESGKSGALGGMYTLAAAVPTSCYYLIRTVISVI